MNFDQAQADNNGAPAEPQVPEPEHPQSTDPRAEHEQLAHLLANPDWTPAAAQEGNPPHEENGPPSPDHEPAREPGSLAAEPDEGHKDPERFRFKDPADRRFAVLRKEGVAPEDAARIAYGIGGQSTQQQSAEQAPDALTAIQQRLAQVDSELDEAGANEGVINSEIVALIRERGDLAAEVKLEAKWRDRDVQAAADQARIVQQQSVTAAGQRFPTIASADSLLRKEADRLLTVHSGSTFLQRTDAPLELAEQAAVNVARAQAKANGTTFEVELAKLDRGAASPPPAAPGRAQSAPRVSIASGARATQGADRAKTEDEQFRAVSGSTSAKEQHEALSRLLYGN